MATPKFASTGSKTDSIDVRLSYKIVELFSEGLYSSPNKAIEELVANSFDAGAQRVHVLLSSNLHAQDATIAIIDNGGGMDVEGLKRHWLIGLSNKRNLDSLPRGRQQIGKFGIGKLATYVLAERLTHISKVSGKFYSTSMDYTAIDSRVSNEVEPKAPIKISLLELTEGEAKTALTTWTETEAFKGGNLKLFGKQAPKSWTVAVMSSLKPKVHEIRPGTLKWILRTALPLRPDFNIRLNTEDLISSKAGKGVLKKWVIGKDLVELPRPGSKEATAFEDEELPADDEQRIGLELPDLGKVSGYVEAYKDLLTGKSDELGRSYGFFVYVYGRLINVIDGHFGISPNELRHGTFGRVRVVVHIDGLDTALRSNRETLSEGPLLTQAQNLLRAVFNSVRQTIETHDEGEVPGARLARKMSSSPASLSRKPIVDLARSVIQGNTTSRYLVVPDLADEEEKDDFISAIEIRADHPDDFVTGLSIDYDGNSSDGLARYDTATGTLRINAWHPFIATFYDEFAHKKAGEPLELLAMAEVLSEAHMHAIGLDEAHIEDYFLLRDQLLRNLANESGRRSALSISNDLLEARNDPDGLEEQVCAAFGSLGFEAIPIGGKKKPDGVATAYLSASKDGEPQAYKVSLEAKSKSTDSGTVAAATVQISTIARHRDDHQCQHAIVVGRDFPTTKSESSLEIEIDADRKNSIAKNEPKTITLIRIDDLAKLVKIRPIKQITLKTIRSLFKNCRLPDECAEWVREIAESEVSKPPYKKIVETIEELQKRFDQAPVNYGSLRVALDGKGIQYATDQELTLLCQGMQQMAPGAIYATSNRVELQQSSQNVISEIENATNDYSIDDHK